MHSGSKDISFDLALIEAAAALIDELNSAPVPKNIVDLADKLQAVLDQKRDGRPVEAVAPASASLGVDHGNAL